MHRLQERAAVLTNRVTLEARAAEDEDERRFRREVASRPDGEQSEPVERSGRRPALGEIGTAAALGTE